MTDERQEKGGRAKVARRRAARMDRPPESATGDIDRVFERMRTLAPPAKIDQAWATSFTLPDAVKILTFLGIAEEGKPVDTALWNRVRLPASREEALGELVREAYKPIFDQIADVAEASREDIEGAFVNQYNLGDTGRYLRAFGAFCRHAGISVPALEPRRAEVGSGGTKPPRTDPPARTKPQTPKPAAASTARDERGKPSTGGSGSLTASVVISPEWTEEQIRERLALVKRLVDEAGR